MKAPTPIVFTLATRATSPAVDPICQGLTMSTAGVTECLTVEDIEAAIESRDYESDDEPLDELIDAHRELWVIATCYTRSTYNALIDRLMPMLIDDRFDDERHLKLVHISTLRDAALEVLIATGEVKVES